MPFPGTRELRRLHRDGSTTVLTTFLDYYRFRLRHRGEDVTSG